MQVGDVRTWAHTSKKKTKTKNPQWVLHSLKTLLEEGTPLRDVLGSLGTMLFRQQVLSYIGGMCILEIFIGQWMMNWLFESERDEVPLAPAAFVGKGQPL